MREAPTHLVAQTPAATDMPDYGPTARALHWIIALLLAAQFVVAWTMEVPEEAAPPTFSANLHASLGVTVFVVVVIRLLWRLSHPVAPLPDIPGWQRTLSVLTHFALYLALLVVPLAGAVMVMGEGVQILLYGLIPLPILTGAGDIAEIAEEAHELLALVLLLLVGLHVFAALYHYFIRRDRVMQRMLPRL